MKGVAFAHIYPRNRHPFPDSSVREHWDELLGPLDSA